MCLCNCVDNVLVTVCPCNPTVTAVIFTTQLTTSCAHQGSLVKEISIPQWDFTWLNILLSSCALVIIKSVLIN